MRLRMLAHAIKVWNENTGALSHLEIEPLPHQIHLVHHIIASGNYNWLIADDVGLGKTIETGMLLHALRQRDLIKRILLVTPAGLTKQWQEELYHKFKIEDFEIYGEDFFINEPRQWKMHDCVIGSMDRLKQEGHLESLLQAEPWDLVIFDEGHRLSRRQYGQKLDSSERYDLAKSLRSQTEHMLLLSATPHQGMQDKFVALLELLRPERRTDLMALNIKPEILHDMVFRNHKADVTDAEGNFIFQGKITSALQVPSSKESIEFDKTLQDYLRKGYDAGEALGRTGNAIGFVMTVYRKLAASSAAAIHRALCNRLQRLLDDEANGLSDEEPRDQRYLGEWEEQFTSDAREFFAGEVQLLKDLIAEAAALKANDLKLKLFIEDIIGKIHAANADEKVLIFTEYRTTQNYLREALADHYGSDQVELINGSMQHAERREAIKRFEEQGGFLISTEAGGEGINLQSKCHVMVNYDLPWNPMRLVQRIGRLYRYGQKKKVVVFNIQQTDSLDQNIVDLMYERIDSVVTDLAEIQRHEFNEGLKDEILGQLAELIDVEDILQEATKLGIDRTRERIDEALKQARTAAAKQRELFAHAATSDPNELRDELEITVDHLYSFVLGMFDQLGIEVAERSHKERLLRIRLSEQVMRDMGLSPKASRRMDVTLDRMLAANRPDTHMLDLNSKLMQYLLGKACEYDFGGLAAILKAPELEEGALLGAMLRWQGPQGKRMRQEFVAIQVNDGKAKLNPAKASQWLLTPAEHSPQSPDTDTSKLLFKVAEEMANQRLANASNRYLIPENLDWASAGWTHIH
ncbi:TPA: helicase-related protein [Pseudomonas aeruginosa]|uniref:DEAD/DEAH box helicase n=1 Tax=Pseudomonas aeruginosa TaxID=287 RepID=UPI00068FCB13|nr:helicase-related protein [Pseudomonas aeruginosa]MCG6996219.1 DEAD/DEAH box helicase [Pseudomonas aeruginosa]MCG7002326.1 DEAD/DEAH box helicase [Pseudomonas aeruginosa]MDV7969152.1 helicase-related protein [Pseudomonas aeruginosa]HCK7264445.1 DEAD/DEAH box helicase [Pseudomonas aeruginosa]HEJ3152655.1 DEAD/DEAH box helicase [Pseudomonas aeruginosa]